MAAVPPSFVVQPPLQFDFKNAGQWPQWVQRFEDYSFASGLYAAKGEVRTRTLLYCMGPQARTILTSLALGDDELGDYAKVKEKFDAYFVHPVNELYESARFLRRAQQPGESADAFYTALCNMAKRCNYRPPEVEDRLIRDRFVVGLLDAKLSDRLCRNSKLTLEEALVQVRQHEDSEAERKLRESAALGTTALNIDAAKVRKHRPPRQAQAQATGGSVASLCIYCGRSSHPRSECPANRAACNLCHKKGHFAAVCRARKGKLSSVELAAVSARGGARSKFVEVKVNGLALNFKVDSGAEVSVVPSTFSGIPAHLQRPDGELTGPGGHPLEVLGTFMASLSWKDKCVKQELYVVRSQTVPLLGFPAIQALGVVKFVDHIPEVPLQQAGVAVPSELFQGLGELPGEYTIRLQPDAVPFSLPVARRIPIPLRDVVKSELDEMESKGVIRRVVNPTPWCAGLVVVPKSAGGYRLCVDLTKLNKVVLRERHILPTVDQVLGLLGDARVFSKLDATSSFHQVKLTEGCQEMTTFITPFGRYCFRRLPFGITSAPEYFQRVMANILEGQMGAVNMIDDILVFGRDRAEHDQRLTEVLQRLRTAGLTLNREKCKFGVTTVDFLGVVVNEHGISPDPKKCEAVQEMEPPVDVGGIRRLLGMVNHVGRFLPHLSDTTAPLRALLSKNSAWTWGPDQEAAFLNLKRMLSSEVCMARYHPALPTIVSADASSFGLGAVLLQDQSSGERRAVAFASRSLTPTEQRYSQTEKEALAITWAVQRFDEYVRGLQFLVETDHLPLTSLFGSMDVDMLPPRVQRLRLKLMRYQFRVLHVPGKLLATADTLSRAPLGQVLPAVGAVELFVESVVQSIQDKSPVRLDRLRQEQASDGECVILLKYCEQGWPVKPKVAVNLLKYWKHRGEFTVCDGLLLKGSRLVVPASLQGEVLGFIHEGHQGVNRCRARARDSVWWPGVSKQIKSMVEDCERCASTRVQRAEPLVASPSPELPWQQLGIDLFHFNGQDFLLIVDYFSRYPEVITLKSTTCSSVITAVKSVLARFGIPEVVRSDNGPQFAAAEFADFAQDYGFVHATSSPHYPQSNGEVERAIRTIKDLLRKGDDPFLALLVFRDTPGRSGFSPAQLLMGRRLRTRMVKPPEKLKPEWPSTEVFLERDRQDKRRQTADYNRRHAAKELRGLAAGDEVWVKDARCSATVLSRAQRPRSYIVETPQGVLQRNRKHLVPYRPEKPALSPGPEPPERGQRGPGSPATSEAVRPSPPAPQQPDGVKRTRCGRAVIAPRRLNL